MVKKKLMELASKIFIPSLFPSLQRNQSGNLMISQYFCTCRCETSHVDGYLCLQLKILLKLKKNHLYNC